MRTRGGSGKGMFGSNHPMIAPRQALEHLHHLKIDDETQERFLHANAERVFGLYWWVYWGTLVFNVAVPHLNVVAAQAAQRL